MNYDEIADILEDLPSDFRKERLRRNMSREQVAAESGFPVARLRRFELRIARLRYDLIIEMLRWMASSQEMEPCETPEHRTGLLK